MCSGDLWFETKQALLNKYQQDKQSDKYNKLIGIIEINCLARTKNLKKQGKMEETAKLFNFVPHIGLSSVGEIYMSLISYTSVMLFLYEPEKN